MKIDPENFDDVISPIDPGVLLKDLDFEKIKIFESAKRPMMFSWSNGAFLFKAEDDLRQDVLGIQIMQMLDYSWKDRKFHKALAQNFPSHNNCEQIFPALVNLNSLW